MKWFYAPEYDFGRNLPQHGDVHGFVLDKPSRIRQRLLTADVVRATDFVRPEPVGEQEVGAVHEEVVLYDLHDPYAVSRAIEFDALARLDHETVWDAVVAPQLHAAGGTREALRAAAQGEWATNLSGGFHHARPDLSHGLCLVNDIAIGIAGLRREGLERRILILDLDLHQGDGNAIFFAKDDDVFTCSMHEQAVFPAEKLAGDLDVGLPSGIDDDPYLERLETVLEEVGERFAPEIVIYVAGSDPFANDPLGSLRLTLEGLTRRDRRVADFAIQIGAPLVTLPAGGYSDESATLAALGFAEIAARESAHLSP